MMNKLSIDEIAGFLGCECATSEYQSPLHTPSPMYEFEAKAASGAITLLVIPALDHCGLRQVDADGIVIAAAGLNVTDLKVCKDINEATGNEEEYLLGLGPSGQFSITRLEPSFSVFYSTYADGKAIRAPHG